MGRESKQHWKQVKCSFPACGRHGEAIQAHPKIAWNFGCCSNVTHPEQSSGEWRPRALGGCWKPRAVLACWNKKGRWWHLRPVPSKCSLQHVNPWLHQRLRISSSCLQKSQISVPYHLRTTAKRGFTQCCIDPDILYNGYFSKRHCPHKVNEEGNWRVLTLIDFFYSGFLRKWDSCNEIACVCLPLSPLIPLITLGLVGQLQPSWMEEGGLGAIRFLPRSGKQAAKQGNGFHSVPPKEGLGNLAGQKRPPDCGEG